VKFYRQAFIVLLLLVGGVARADEAAEKLWLGFLENACKPVDGHFVVEITRMPVFTHDEPALRSVIEYWILGTHRRFDVDDKAGRDLHAQVVLRSDGDVVFDNFDTTNARVVVSESAKGSKMSVPSRSQWLYFQTLLGRIPFSPLALYDESFDSLKSLNKLCSLELRVLGQIRELQLKSSEGRVMVYRFNDASVNPYEIEVIGDDGVVDSRLRAEWNVPSGKIGKPIAFSGVLETRNEHGSLVMNYEWKHLLAEEMPSSIDPFAWESMNLAVGKKRILFDSNNEESAGGYWDGKKFSEIPITVTGISPFRRFLISVGIVGLLASVFWLLIKFNFFARAKIHGKA
jgi:hypothetical protein